MYMISYEPICIFFIYPLQPNLIFVINVWFGLTFIFELSIYTNGKMLLIIFTQKLILNNPNGFSTALLGLYNCSSSCDEIIVFGQHSTGVIGNKNAKFSPCIPRRRKKRVFYLWPCLYPHLTWRIKDCDIQSIALPLFWVKW